jgi:DNA-binding transcriptional LysR family regulator
MHVTVTRLVAQLETQGVIERLPLGRIIFHEPDTWFYTIQVGQFMTLEQLRIFLAVAEHLHFTHAAEVLYISQPAVSAAVQSLESEYSVKLFHRVGRRVEITEAGQILQKEAQTILEQVAIAKRNLQELNNLQQGELRIGASLTIGNYWLPDKLSQFQQQYPAIRVACTLANAEEICTGTASGRFDIGFISGDIKPILKPSLEQEIVGQDHLYIVIGQGHPWFGQSKILVEELSQADWVMREPGSGAQQIFEQALQQWGINVHQLKTILTLSSSEMVKAVVEGGIGAAALPGLMVEKELKLNTLRAIHVIDRNATTSQFLKIEQPIFKLRHSQRYRTKAMFAFEQMLQGQDLQGRSNIKQKSA